jgi:hypothetical protein
MALEVIVVLEANTARVASAIPLSVPNCEVLNRSGFPERLRLSRGLAAAVAARANVSKWPRAEVDARVNGQDLNGK